jgi:3-methyl-2-oxobutanoate hydroxymethyltransferase
MLRHTAAVARGATRALVVADMPFLSYQVDDDDAIMNAGRLVAEAGAKAVKLEGGGEVAEIVARIVDVGIPVWGHVGMTPQSVHLLGGYRMQGKDSENAERIKREALELQEAGACAIVLELIPAALAKEITASLVIPTIGIGAGPDCDGQVLVTHDMLGLYDKFVHSFAKQYANLWQTTLKAFKAYNQDVKSGKFPEKR